MTSSWRTAYHLLSVRQLFSEARAALWEVEEECFFFPCVSLRTGVGSTVIITISIGHNMLHQNLLNYLWCFILYLLLFCSAVWLHWSKRTTSRVTALLVPYLNLIIKNFLSSEWLLIDWYIAFHPFQPCEKLMRRAGDLFICHGQDVRSMGNDVAL